ncbi:MAG: ABC transporter permease [Acidobacteriota bacterium]
MFDLDDWQEIWNALSHNKLRTLLTAFGVFWGIFMLVIMLGSGNGLRNGVDADFTSGATNSVFIWPQRTSMPFRGLPEGRRFNFDNDDTAAVIAAIPNASIVAPRAQLGGWRGAHNVTRGNKAGAFDVMGDVPENFRIQPVKLVAGRLLNPLDVAERRKVAVIGERVRDLLFEADEPVIGGSIQVQGVYFKVVGVFASLQDGEDGQRSTQTLFIPISTFQRAFNWGNLISWLAITSRDDVPASQVEAEVKALLAERHRIHPNDRWAMGSFNLEEEYNQVRGLFAGIRVLVWIVGAGTLAAGVIGVSNILLILVKERTKEIGLRRAIGASPFAVIRQILLEALALTSLAGYCGLVAGIGVLELVRQILVNTDGNGGMFRNPGVDLQTAAIALLILVFAGTFAGLIPARRAVAVRPVAALRSD